MIKERFTSFDGIEIKGRKITYSDFVNAVKQLSRNEMIQIVNDVESELRKKGMKGKIRNSWRKAHSIPNRPEPYPAVNEIELRIDALLTLLEINGRHRAG